MAYGEPARTTRRDPVLITRLLVVTAVAAAVGCAARTSPSSTAVSPIDLATTATPTTAATPTTIASPSAPRAAPPSTTATPLRRLSRAESAPGRLRSDGGALGQADGVVPDGTTVFDDVPGVANLDPDLLSALRRAATDAARDGIELFVESGWRSAAYQDQLLRAAVTEYGSEKEAARWVATPATSAHVSGDAVDIGPFDAAAWLSAHGAKYGLCQIYRNEPWHYELRPAALRQGCPPMYADPTRDPRMQQ